jgi:hypothetical protein
LRSGGYAHGARAIGADADVGFAWSGGGDGAGADRAQGATGSSLIDRKICSTDSLYSHLTLFVILSCAREAGRRDAIWIYSTRSIGLVGASAAGRGFDGEVGGAVVDFFFVIFDSGPTRELGQQIDLPGPRCGCWPTSTSSF